MDPNKLLSKVNCQFGAPVGRISIKDNPHAKVRLFRVRMIGDGCYDVGGAYWGMATFTVLYCAIGDGFQTFRWAKNRADAKTTLQTQFPDLRFYR